MEEDPSLPSTNTEEEQPLPSTSKDEEQSLPLRTKEEEQSSPLRTVDEDPSLPSTNIEEEESLPSTLKGEEQSLPSSLKDEERSLPLIASEEEQSSPSTSEDDESRVVVTRPSRTQLLFEFDMQRAARQKEKPEIDYFVPRSYAPSICSLQDLRPMTIADLRIGKYKSGRVLYLKTIETALRAAGIHTIVEDAEGVVERLAIYNVDFALEAEDFLPEDTLIAIKEPLITSFPSGGYTIRTDHPTDVVMLSGSESGIPPKLASSLPKDTNSALDWKKIGNDFYSRGEHFRAILAYSKGLARCTENETSLKYDLLRNRSICNIQFGRFKQGLEDGEAAVIHPVEDTDEATKELNAKAYSRAGLAAYSRGNYDQAEDLYKKSLNLSKQSQEAALGIKRIEKRREEQTTGAYDFEKMSRLCTSKRNRLDHASYLSNTVIKDAGKHGRGLFTTKAFSAGELIMCEKALYISFDSDPGVPQDYKILDSHGKRKVIGSGPPLLFSICSKAALDIDAATKLFNLFDGQHAGTQVIEVDGTVVINTFRVLGVLNHNSIGCPSVATTSTEAQTQISKSIGYPSTGIWERASYINHACNGNAMRSFIGNMILVRATRDIKKDEEIFMPYSMPDIDIAFTQKVFQGWGFKCDCELCDAESHSTAIQIKDRNAVRDKLTNLVIDNEKHFRVEPYYKKVKATYDDRIFKNLPRIGLLRTGWTLCNLHLRAKAWTKLVASAGTLLQDLGYTIQMDDRIIEVNRQHCLTVHYGPDAALFAGHGYKKLGKDKIAAQFDELAKNLWIILCGTVHGLDHRTKKLLLL